MHVEPHHDAEELEALAGEQSRVTQWRRRRAVFLAHEGHTAEAIAVALGCTPRAVQKWVARYTGSPPGRRPRTGSAPSTARMSAGSSATSSACPCASRGDDCKGHGLRLPCPLPT